MAKEHGENWEGVGIMETLIDLFDVLEEKQKELQKRIDNPEITSGEYYDFKAKIKALEWVKRIIAEEVDADFDVDYYVEI